MKKNIVSTRTKLSRGRAAVGIGDVHFGSMQELSGDERDQVFAGIGQKLREGRSSEAERILTEVLEGYSHSDDDLANLRRLLSFTLETVGRYRE